MVHHLASLAVIGHHQSLLLLIEMQGRLTGLWHKRMLAENLHHRRSRVDSRQLLIFLVSAVEHA